MTTAPEATHSLRMPVAIVAGVLLLVHLTTALLPSLFEPLRHQASDRLFALRNQLERFRPHYDDTIVFVDIDDYSLRSRGDFYVDRPEIARLIENLGSAGIARQFHDFIYAAPRGPDVDRRLIDATREAGGVYFGMAAGWSAASDRDLVSISADPPTAADRAVASYRWPARIDGPSGSLYRTSRLHLTFEALAEAAAGIGFLDITVDRDGTYRRAPLVVRDGDSVIPSLPLRVIGDFLEVDPTSIVIRPGHSIRLPNATRPGEATGHDIVIPIDRRGRMVVNYIGPWGSMTHYPFSEIYDVSDDRFSMELLREELVGKIAVVSQVATGSGDIGPVPGEALFPLSGIHANVLHSILTEQFLREIPAWVLLLTVEIPLLVMLLVAAMRLPTLGFVLAPPVLAIGYAAVAAFAFLKFGWIFDIPGPIFVLALSTLGIAAFQYHSEAKAKAVVRHTFGLYFPPAVADKIMANPDALSRSAHKKVLTILFSDIRSFTHHTSAMEAGHVRSLLNEYFEKMVEIVFKHEGTLDKFIGDGLMVFFGDPLPQADHATRCVRCAIEMQAAAKELAKNWEDRGEMPLEIRIGIHTGEVVVGNMGSERRLSYTALGEPVNLTQRLEAAAPNGGILISAQTREGLDATVRVRPVDPIRVKGFDTPIEVFQIET